jgi:hypothetical protein
MFPLWPRPPPTASQRQPSRFFARKIAAAMLPWAPSQPQHAARSPKLTKRPTLRCVAPTLRPRRARTAGLTRRVAARKS